MSTKKEALELSLNQIEARVRNIGESAQLAVKALQSLATCSTAELLSSIQSEGKTERNTESLPESLQSLFVDCKTSNAFPGLVDS